MKPTDHFDHSNQVFAASCTSKAMTISDTSKQELAPLSQRSSFSAAPKPRNLLSRPDARSAARGLPNMRPPMEPLKPK